MKKIDLTGKKFSELTVLEKSHSDKNYSIRWKCQCNCGNIVYPTTNYLTSGNTRSCGCLQRKLTGDRFRTHGKRHEKIYIVWMHMINRCDDQKYDSYSRYGGRGIKVCSEWYDFMNFYNDMGDPPSGLTIDRIDNNKGYYKANCKWSTRKEQARNRRSNKYLTFDNRTLLVTDWAAHLGVTDEQINKRLYRGWTVEEALSIPFSGNYIKRKNINVFKCDICNKFISKKDLEAGLAIHRILTLDSDYSIEQYETLCRNHSND